MVVGFLYLYENKTHHCPTWRYGFEGSVIDATLVLEGHKVLLVFCVGTVDEAHPIGGCLILSIDKVAWLSFLVYL